MQSEGHGEQEEGVNDGEVHHGDGEDGLAGLKGASHEEHPDAAQQQDGGVDNGERLSVSTLGKRLDRRGLGDRGVYADGGESAIGGVVSRETLHFSTK